MNLLEVKDNLGKTVYYSKSNLEYIPNGCIMRKKNKSFVYYLELLDKNGNSLITTKMDNVGLTPFENVAIC